MRENLAKDEIEAGVDAASLSRIKVRRPKDGKGKGPKKIKSGDITERLQALAEELEATKPDLPPVKPAFEEDGSNLFENAKKKSKRADKDPADILGTSSDVKAEPVEEPVAEEPVEVRSEEVAEPEAEVIMEITEVEPVALEPELAEEEPQEMPEEPIAAKPEALPEEPVARKEPIITVEEEAAAEPELSEPIDHEPEARADKKDRKTKKDEAAVAPSAGVPPRRANWARPAASPGWQKKTHAPDILSYWMELRQGNRYPTWQNLDTMRIGKFWPNCVLVHCDRDAGRLQLEPSFSHELRQAARRANPLRDFSSDIDFTPMVVDWVLSLARDVANTAKPAHGTEYFPSVFDEIPLRVIALPLSEDQVEIDHVLCYVQKL